VVKSHATNPKYRPSRALFLRYAGSDRPAGQVILDAQQAGALPITFLSEPPNQAADYTLIDPLLAIAPRPSTSSSGVQAVPPAPGLTYGGFTPEQRAAYVAWAEDPSTAAPPAFRQLLLANAEVRLLEAGDLAEAACAALLALAAAPAWQADEGLARTLLLALWLRQDSQNLTQWTTELPLPNSLWTPALGCQALLGQPLLPEQIGGLARAWNLPAPLQPPAVLRLRLDSLQSSLAAEPLADALGRLGDAAATPKPWRCHHRDLRLALPQPDVRPYLEPLLADMLSVVDKAEPPSAAAEVAAEVPAPEQASSAQPRKRSAKSSAKEPEARSESDGAHIIVEFGASRSDVFAYVLRQAQRQGGFQQILDENRHIVYRVPFRRSEMRRFWHLYEYVQGWASTRVYCDGRQLDKWQIYPYSQYLR
jgi:hypothetical protein